MFSLSTMNPTTAGKPSSAPPCPSPSPATSLTPHSLSSHSQLSPTRLTLSVSPTRRRHNHRRLQVSGIDAAQPYDYETKLAAISNSHSKLKIAIVGFGNYGQFLAKTLVAQGHTVLAHSRSDYSLIARNLGVTFFSDPHDLCEAHPEVILLCTSIISTESVLKSLPLQRLKRSTLFVDVLSVKEFPRSLFLQVLPRDFDILCTHPMFGPESGKFGWGGLNFVYDKVRIGNDEVRVKRCEDFLDIFRREGCRVVEMTCAKHDEYAAGSQFITHFVGRVLEKLDLEDTPINTKGYESLLNLVANTSKDSFELFYGLFIYNKNAMKQLERLDLAFELVKQQLFGHLHGLLREQLFEGTDMDDGDSKKREIKLLSDVSHNGNGNAFQSEAGNGNGSAFAPQSEDGNRNGSASAPQTDESFEKS
uniref:Arogenate dehydrogenase beta n=1 Tax=Microtea debilis TaxID=696524 RepID=A0A386QX90_9CARY|nr:arogenate dehydrogenase beta [Microtea debilis]